MQSLPDLSQLSHTQKDELIGQLFEAVHTLTAQLAVLQKRVCTSRWEKRSGTTGPGR